MAWVEQVQRRSAHARTWRDSQTGVYHMHASLARLHYETAPDSGVFANAIDATPARIDNAALDGWAITANGWHYALGRPGSGALAGLDGVVGFGGRQGQHWLRFRLTRIGYLHWPTRAFEDLGGAPTYDRTGGRLSQQTLTKIAGPEGAQVALNVASKATWTGIWPGISISWRAAGLDLKEEIAVSQAAREAIPPPSTPAAETYFGFVFRIDASDIPRWLKNGLQQDIAGDFDDGDGDLELRDAVDRLLAFLPISYAYSQRYRRPNGRAARDWVRLRKRIWRAGDGNTYLLVGAPVLELAAMAEGPIVFDPTFNIANTNRDGFSEGTNENVTPAQGAFGIAWIGDNSGSEVDGGWIFETTIDDAPTILTASLAILSGEADGTLRGDWFCYNTAAPSDFNDADTHRISDHAARTTNFVADDFTASWATDTTHTSPSLVQIVQDVCDLGGTGANPTIGLTWREDGSTADAYMEWYDYTDSAANAADLTVTWTAGGGAEYNETGLAVAPGAAAGADANVFTETGAGVAPAVAAEIVADYVKTGGAQAPGAASGADANVFTETGAGVAPAVADGDTSIINPVAGTQIVAGIRSRSRRRLVHLFPLRVSVYPPSSTAAVYAPELERAIIADYSTWYNKGGIAESATIFVPRRDPRAAWAVETKHRLAIRYGLDIVWEGEIETITDHYGSPRGNTLKCSGYWGANLARRTLNKPWADTRLDEGTWQAAALSSNTQADKFTIDRANRLRFVPHQDVVIAPNHQAAVRYTAPTGQTVKRVTASYDFSETAEWEPDGVRNNVLDDQPNARDGSASTTISLTLTAGQYLYVGSKRAWSRARFAFGAALNNNAATLTVEYHNGTDWGAVSGLSDGTAVGGAPFAQDGVLSFTFPNDWDPESLIVDRMYWVRIGTNNTLDAVTIEDIYTGEAQAWMLALRNSAGTVLASVAADGTGTIDHTLATPDQTVWLTFDHAGTTPAHGVGNGSVHAELTSLTVRTETGDITLYEIARDVRGDDTGLNSDETYIDSDASLSLVPFITDGSQFYADILNKAAAFGDAAFNPWNCWVGYSDEAATPNGEPMLHVEAVPALDDYEYVVDARHDWHISVPDLNSADYARNWVVVRYQNELNRRVEITPDDNANLQDATLVAADGERHFLFDAGTASAAAAASLGRRVLAEQSAAQYYMSGPLTVRGAIRTREGTWQPACKIRAGERVRLINYQDDITGDTAGLIVLITKATYRHDTREAQLETGMSDSFGTLSVILTQRDLFRSDRVF